MKKVILVLVGLVTCVNTAFACTLWGTAKPNEILIAKTRDFYPGTQEFRVLSKNDATPQSEQKHYKFFGLYGEDHGKNVLKMGINEKGLTVLIAFASVIPIEMRAAKNSYDDVMAKILQELASVDEIIKTKDQLFKDSTPVFYLFSDRKKALLCEIGLKDKYQCKEFSRGDLATSIKPKIFAQTNHYILKGLEEFNLKPQVENQSSYRRYAKINELMQAHLSDLTLEQFIKFSLDTTAENDNPLASFDKGYDNTYRDNSIFRTFNTQPDRKNKKEPNSAYGIAAMIVDSPRSETAPIRLYLRKTTEVTSSNNNNDKQKVEYEDAIVTLEEALRSSSTHPITYTQHTCMRDPHTTSC